ALGPEHASRSMRQGMRGLISRFAQIGIPAGRVALELQFQSAPGQGGRQGLQPKSAWLEIVKLEALAAKQVAAETKIQGVWSRCCGPRVRSIRRPCLQPSTRSSATGSAAASRATAPR